MCSARTVAATYAVAHFGVDFGCAFAVFAQGDGEKLAFLLYNFCAFALQMPLGVLADRCRRGSLFAGAGSLLVVLLCLIPELGWPGYLLLGIGNALFHVGGGVDVLRLSGERAGLLGVYVSPGALGLFLGTLLGKAGGNPWLSGALVLGSGLLPLMACRKRRWPKPLERPLPGREIALPGLLLFLVVLLRSWAGMAGHFAWKSGVLSLMAVLALALGKCAGGLLADQLGAVPVSALSLALAAGLFLLSGQPWAGLTALFLFNLSMPITLWALARRMPGHEGFAFGLLTFALFLGFVPVYLGAGEMGPVGLALASLFSCLLLTAGLKGGKRRWRRR